MHETSSKKDQVRASDTAAPERPARATHEARLATPATEELHDRELDGVSGGDLYMHNPRGQQG